MKWKGEELTRSYLTTYRKKVPDSHFFKVINVGQAPFSENKLTRQPRYNGTLVYGMKAMIAV
jgi:hypothetical protein